MKKLLLTINEFLKFRQICELYRIRFTYEMTKGGTVTVEAEETKLAEIGY